MVPEIMEVEDTTLLTYDSLGIQKQKILVYINPLVNR
jgi:hypothetical protein